MRWWVVVGLVATGTVLGCGGGSGKTPAGDTPPEHEAGAVATDDGGVGAASDDAAPPSSDDAGTDAAPSSHDAGTDASGGSTVDAPTSEPEAGTVADASPEAGGGTTQLCSVWTNDYPPPAGSSGGACPGNVCNATTCPTGCCTAQNQCMDGATGPYCGLNGLGGAACGACPSSEPYCVGGLTDAGLPSATMVCCYSGSKVGCQ